MPFIPAPEAAHPTPAPDLAAQDASERARLREIKAKALEDKHVRSLQEKADNASNDDDQRKASKAYYKALYGRMRSLDESLKPRIDRMEAATLKRLDEQTIGGGQ